MLSGLDCHNASCSRISLLYYTSCSYEHHSFIRLPSISQFVLFFLLYINGAFVRLLPTVDRRLPFQLLLSSFDHSIILFSPFSSYAVILSFRFRCCVIMLLALYFHVLSTIPTNQIKFVSSCSPLSSFSLCYHRHRYRPSVHAQRSTKKNSILFITYIIIFRSHPSDIRFSVSQFLKSIIMTLA